MNRWGCLGNVMRRRYANEAENKLTHAHCHIRNTHTHTHITFPTFSIYKRICAAFQGWLELCAHKHRACSKVWYKGGISLSYYSQIFLPSLCMSAMQMSTGRNRREGEGGWGRKKRHTIRGGETPQGNVREREGCRRSRREYQSPWDESACCPFFHYLPGPPPTRITTTPPRCRRNVRTPTHTHTHLPSVHPSSPLHWATQEGGAGKQTRKEPKMNTER